MEPGNLGNGWEARSAVVVNGALVPGSPGRGFNTNGVGERTSAASRTPVTSFQGSAVVNSAPAPAFSLLWGVRGLEAFRIPFFRASSPQQPHERLSSRKAGLTRALFRRAHRQSSNSSRTALEELTVWFVP